VAELCRLENVQEETICDLAKQIGDLKEKKMRTKKNAPAGVDVVWAHGREIETTVEHTMWLSKDGTQRVIARPEGLCAQVYSGVDAKWCVLDDSDNRAAAIYKGALEAS